MSTWRYAIFTGWSRSSRPSAPRWKPWPSWRLPGWAALSRATGRDATASAATTGGCPSQSRPAPSGPSRLAGTATCCWRRSTPRTRPWAGRRGGGAVLRATWIQQVYLDGGQVRWRDKQTGLPPGKLLILNPYDPDARPGVKRARTWRGYKAHCTEACEPDRPR